MLYINDTCTDPYWNLAAEEYLLKHKDEPIFRLWINGDAIIIGQYQNAVAEIDTNYVKEHKIKVVRRLSGGGAVFHDLGNLNFTFIQEREKGEDAHTMFRRFTAPIIDALRNIGVEAYLEGRNDLLIDGRKFSGNAICIHKNRTLQHGTLLFSASMNTLGAALKSRPEKFIGKAVQSNRSRVTNISGHLDPHKFPSGTTISDITGFKEYLAEYICNTNSGIVPYTYTARDIEAIDKLCREKYSKDEWNFGKSPSYSFTGGAKFQGGLIEASFDVSQGKICGLQIMGDYFFTRPTEEFCDMMIGTEHTPDGIRKAIAGIEEKLQLEGTAEGINAFFNNIAAEEIASLFFDSGR